MRQQNVGSITMMWFDTGAEACIIKSIRLKIKPNQERWGLKSKEDTVTNITTYPNGITGKEWVHPNQ